MGIDFLNKRLFHPLYPNPIFLNKNYQSVILTNLNVSDPSYVNITKLSIVNKNLFKKSMVKPIK